nr:SHOCT domain-containing protein [Lachnospiraceae bacterium]
TAFVTEKEIPLSDSPAFTVRTAGSGFRYESNRGQRLLKVTFRSKDNEYYYYIKDQADRSYEYDKTFGTFLRMIRKLKEKADLAELNEKEEHKRQEMERQACLELERQQAELKEQQEEERKRAEEQEKERQRDYRPLENKSRNTVRDLMLQRNDMRATIPSVKPDEKSVSGSDRGYDSLIELRKLLDAGIITEEEFTAKKRQILGI